MDYYENTNGVKNTNMKYILFSKSQWDTIINTGVEKKLL